MTANARDMDAWLDDLARGLVSGAEGAPKGAVVWLKAPGLGFEGAAAAGIANADGEAMTTDSSFHVASIGKLFTATMVLQLAEVGAFGPAGVDATLGELGALEDVLLDRLHRADGVSRGRAITVRQLLTHTSGLGDAFGDDAKGTAAKHGRPAPGGLSAGFWRSLKARRAGEVTIPDLVSKVWSPWEPEQADDRWAGLLNYYIAELGRAPVHVPGEAFHYSDQGFVLLALLVERLGGEPYGVAQRRRILAPLGLEHSWMHGETPRAKACEVWMNGVPVMAHGATMSFDWGGGGQVCDAADLIRFLDGLLAGALFEKAETLAAMTDWVQPVGLAAPRVGLGLGLQCWASAATGTRGIGHAGAWGARLWRDPITGATVAGTVNQSDPGLWAFAVLDEVRRRSGHAA